MEHTYSCPFPEGCNCGATEFNRLRAQARDKWVRGYTNAVAVLVQNYPEPPIVDCLLRNGPGLSEILRHADEEDITTLRSAGYLKANK